MYIRNIYLNFSNLTHTVQNKLLLLFKILNNLVYVKSIIYTTLKVFDNNNLLISDIVVLISLITRLGN